MGGKEGCKGSLEAATISDILFLIGQGNFIFIRVKSGNSMLKGILKSVCGNHVFNANIYGLLTELVRSRWLDIGQVLFACFKTETGSRSINTQKRTRPISSHLDRTSLVNKGFIIWNKNSSFLGDTSSNPERARYSNFARSGSQSAHDSVYILTELTIWYMYLLTWNREILMAKMKNNIRKKKAK